MEKTRAIGYIRVSTEEQVREGVSLDAQEAKIRAYATAKDLDLVEEGRNEVAGVRDARLSGEQDRQVCVVLQRVEPLK